MNPSIRTHRAALNAQPVTSLHCKAPIRNYRASRGVPGYSPACTGTHCTYSRMDSQAELTWVACYISKWSTRLVT